MHIAQKCWASPDGARLSTNLRSFGILKTSGLKPDALVGWADAGFIDGSPTSRIAQNVGLRDQAASAWRSSNARIKVLVNAGISSGLRLVIRLPLSTTSLSSQCAPAFSRSARNEGHDVRCFSLTRPA